MKILLALGAACLASCVAVEKKGSIALVCLDIDGSPIVGPGGPRIYVDGVYRGNPVGSHFHIWLSAGDHEIELMLLGGSDNWKETVTVSDWPKAQAVKIRYDVSFGDDEHVAAADEAESRR